KNYPHTSVHAAAGARNNVFTLFLFRGPSSLWYSNSEASSSLGCTNSSSSSCAVLRYVAPCEALLGSMHTNMRLVPSEASRPPLEAHQGHLHSHVHDLVLHALQPS